MKTKKIASRFLLSFSLIGFIVFMGLLVTSCGAEWRVKKDQKNLGKIQGAHPDWFTEHHSDKTVTTDSYTSHDTIIKEKADSILYSVPCPENSDKTTHRGALTLRVRTVHDTVYADCEVDSNSIYLSWKERHTSTLEIKADTGTMVRIVPQPPTWWQTTQMRSGDAFFLLLLAAIIYFAIRLYLKFKP